MKPGISCINFYIKSFSGSTNTIVIWLWKSIYTFDSKYKYKKSVYNHFYNILRLFDVLPSFCFTTSETMGDYYL